MGLRLAGGRRKRDRELSDAPIIFEDEHLLVLNKPTGLAVAPGPGVPAKAPTLLGQWQVLPRFGEVLLKNAHRVDTPVSGVVVLAKSKAALDSASGEFQSKMAQRVYEAFVVITREGEVLGLEGDYPAVRTASTRSTEPPGKPRTTSHESSSAPTSSVAST